MRRDSLKQGLLLDYYGELLTEKQRLYCDLYFNQDYSLAEIAEQTGISRQGVHDSLLHAEAALKEFERIQAEKIAFITQELDLSPEEAQAFWPVYNQCWKEAREANKKMRDAFGELRGKKGEELSEKEIEAKLDAYIQAYAFSYAYSHS